MTHYQATLSSKGQLTMPAPVRDFFDLKAGDTIDFFLNHRTRSVRLRARNRPIETAFGCLNKYVDPFSQRATPDQMERAIGDHSADENARISRRYAEWQEFMHWKRHRQQGGQ